MPCRSIPKPACSWQFSPSAISRRTMTRTASTTSATSRSRERPTSSRSIITLSTCQPAPKTPPTQMLRRACSPLCAPTSTELSHQPKELTMATQQPSYQAYTVVKREGQDDFWLNIGAAFMHQDGDGYNIMLQALPINGKIVLRPPKAQTEETAERPAKDNNKRRTNRDRRKDK